MSFARTAKYILNHPLNRQQRFSAARRFVGWQLRSRLLAGPLVADFVNGAKLKIRRGMTGATGNVYCGLHEFEDMSFALHFLRRGDLFYDVGANVGSYTVLASAGIGARTRCFEPVPTTYRSLLDNIEVNGISSLVESFNHGLGSEDGSLEFTSGLDSINHVVTDRDAGQETTTVEVKRLDDVACDEAPCLMKIDVEGFEAHVLAGGPITLADERLVAVIIELNGSGARYGSDDDALHGTLIDRGFHLCAYEPFTRCLKPIHTHATSGNSLYVKDVDEVAQRLAEAPPYRVNGMTV